MHRRKPTVPPAHEHKSHRDKALDHLAIADELSRKSHGEDGRIPHELAAAQIHATLAVAEELAPTITMAEERLLDLGTRIMPCADEHPFGSAGLCMEPRTGLAPAFAANEFCTRPTGHEGAHSWKHPLDLETLGPTR